MITFQQAYDLVKDIPEEEWITRQFTDGVSKCCIMGHLTRLTSADPSNYNIVNCSDLERERKGDSSMYDFRIAAFDKGIDLASINNGNDVRFPQALIKDRVLAALKYLIDNETN